MNLWPSPDIKPTWQKLRRAMSLKKIEEIAILKKYLLFLADPLLEELDILDKCLLHSIYENTGKSVTINNANCKTYWVSLWSNYLIYQGCHFYPLYPEEIKQKTEPPPKELIARINKLKRIFSNRIRKLNAHGLIDIEIDWENLEEEIEEITSDENCYIWECWLIAVRATYKGYELLKKVGYDTKFVPPQKYEN
jgi:hypothetical protein